MTISFRKRIIGLLITCIVFLTGIDAEAQCELHFNRSKPAISPVNGSVVTQADMNADGRLDIIGLQEDPFDSNNRQKFFILPGNGQGGFGVPLVIDARPGWRMDDLIVGDYDNDNLRVRSHRMRGGTFR